VFFSSLPIEMTGGQLPQDDWGPALPVEGGQLGAVATAPPHVQQQPRNEAPSGGARAHLPPFRNNTPLGADPAYQVCFCVCLPTESRK